MQNWVIKNDTAGSINSSMTTEDLSERLSEDIINDNHELANFSLSCKLCKKQHDAIILRAVGWGCWKNCASKSERQVSQSIHLDVTTALANLVICLDKSGHTAETLEVAQAVMKHTQRGDDFRS